MAIIKSDIFGQLQKDILRLEGFKSTLNNAILDAGLGVIKNAFPNASFPLGAIHEFICGGAEDAVATKDIATESQSAPDAEGETLADAIIRLNAEVEQKYGVLEASLAGL